MPLYRRVQRLRLERRDADGGLSIGFPVDQRHIADTLGLSLVPTHKTLRRLQQLGLHELRDNSLRLFNPRALRKIAN